MPRFTLLLSLWLCNNFALAQQCDVSIPATTRSADYFVNDDGSVTDLEKGITWMRCALGQEWDGTHCTGEAISYDWHQAHKAGTTSRQHKWRLPSLPELASIVEQQCQMPRINAQLFPDTPNAVFWTANHKLGSQGKSYAMDFASEGLIIADQSARHLVRLVYGRD